MSAATATSISGHFTAAISGFRRIATMTVTTTMADMKAVSANAMVLHQI